MGWKISFLRGMNIEYKPSVVFIVPFITLSFKFVNGRSSENPVGRDESLEIVWRAPKTRVEQIK